MHGARLAGIICHARDGAHQARELLCNGAFTLGQRVLDLGGELEVRVSTAQHAQPLCQTSMLALPRRETLELRQLLAHALLPHVTTGELTTHPRQLSPR